MRWAPTEWKYTYDLSKHLPAWEDALAAIIPGLDDSAQSHDVLAKALEHAVFSGEDFAWTKKRKAAHLIAERLVADGKGQEIENIIHKAVRGQFEYLSKACFNDLLQHVSQAELLVQVAERAGGREACQNDKVAHALFLSDFDAQEALRCRMKEMATQPDGVERALALLKQCSHEGVASIVVGQLPKDDRRLLTSLLRHSKPGARRALADRLSTDLLREALGQVKGWNAPGRRLEILTALLGKAPKSLETAELKEIATRHDFHLTRRDALSQLPDAALLDLLTACGRGGTELKPEDVVAVLCERKSEKSIIAALGVVASPQEQLALLRSLDPAVPHAIPESVKRSADARVAGLGLLRSR